MAITIKIAQSAKEIDDIFKLRYQVYVVEDGKFGEEKSKRIFDRYDALQGVANIIAYEEGVAVGTIRVVKDTGCGLPTDEVFDFSEYKKSIKTNNTLFVCAGMLAISSSWRNRRDVIAALFKMATGVCKAWGVTHAFANANHEVISVYERVGFEPVDEKIWVEEVKNYVIPMASPFSRPCEWAFGELVENNLDDFWLEHFSNKFVRVLLSVNEVLFNQGDEADAVYIVDNGWVNIVKHDDSGQELNLAALSKGALFGELALIDNHDRSASAVAMTNAEIIKLGKDDFLSNLKNSVDGVEKLLQVFADRLRATDELALVMAYAPQTARVKYALDKLKSTAKPRASDEKVLIAKCGPQEIARVAGVREFEVRRILEMEKQQKKLDYSEKRIRFYRTA